MLLDGFGLIESPLVGGLGLAHLGAGAVFASPLGCDGGDHGDNDDGERDVFGPRLALLFFLRGRPVGFQVADELLEFADFCLQVVHSCKPGNDQSHRPRFAGVIQNCPHELPNPGNQIKHIKERLLVKLTYCACTVIFDCAIVHKVSNSYARLCPRECIHLLIIPISCSSIR